MNSNNPIDTALSYPVVILEDSPKVNPQRLKAIDNSNMKLSDKQKILSLLKNNLTPTEDLLDTFRILNQGVDSLPNLEDKKIFIELMHYFNLQFFMETYNKSGLSVIDIERLKKVIDNIKLMSAKNEYEESYGALNIVAGIVLRKEFTEDRKAIIRYFFDYVVVQIASKRFPLYKTYWLLGQAINILENLSLLDASQLISLDKKSRELKNEIDGILDSLKKDKKEESTHPLPTELKSQAAATDAKNEFKTSEAKDNKSLSPKKDSFFKSQSIIPVNPISKKDNKQEPLKSNNTCCLVM